MFCIMFLGTQSAALAFRQIVPQNTVVPFHRIGLRPGLYMPVLHEQLLIGLPVIRIAQPDLLARKLRYQPSAGLSPPGATHKIDELPAISINSNPYPAVVFLLPT